MKTQYNLTETELFRLEEFFKLFSNTSRLKILLKLNESECLGQNCMCEKCGCECGAGELAKDCGLSQSAASHQLKDLKQCRIVKTRKEGQNIFYSLDDEHIAEIIKCGIEHIRGENCDE